MIRRQRRKRLCFIFMQEYNNFKNSTFSPLIVSRDDNGGGISIDTDPSITGGSLRGGIIPVNCGLPSIKIVGPTHPNYNGTLANSVLEKDKYKLDFYGEDIFKGVGDYKIRSGYYVYLFDIGGNTGGVNKNRDNDIFKDGTAGYSFFPYEYRTTLTVPFYNYHPSFGLRWLSSESEPENGPRANAGYLFFDGRSNPEYLEDFDKLSYTPSSEERVQDSFMATTSYGADEEKPTLHNNIADFINDSKWEVENDLTFFEDRDSEYPWTNGLYMYIVWCSSESEKDPNRSFFLYGTTYIPYWREDGMTFISNLPPLAGFDTFGQINRAGVYLKRLTDLPRFEDQIGYNDINQLTYVPTKRPEPHHAVNSMYYAFLGDEFIPPSGNSFFWNLGPSFGDAGIPEWQDQIGNSTPRVAFVSHQACFDNMNNASFVTSPSEVTIGFTDGTQYIQRNSSVTNWTMVPLKGRKISYVFINYDDVKDWDISQSTIQVVNLN